MRVAKAMSNLVPVCSPAVPNRAFGRKRGAELAPDSPKQEKPQKRPRMPRFRLFVFYHGGLWVRTEHRGLLLILYPPTTLAMAPLLFRLPSFLSRERKKPRGRSAEENFDCLESDDTPPPPEWGGTLDLEAFAMGNGKQKQKNPGALGEMATLTGGLTGVAKPIYQFPETCQQPLTAPFFLL